MYRDFTPALDLLDLAIASSDGLASEADREAAAGLAAAARRRRDFLSGAIVVAIAGGTGSGKSSLLNAIAGREVASTSALRPHTDEPLAWIPADDVAIRFGFAPHVGAAYTGSDGVDFHAHVALSGRFAEQPGRESKRAAHDVQ